VMEANVSQFLERAAGSENEKPVEIRKSDV
jgi:hypothetical protein